MILPLKDQCVSLELAKQLKELGFEQDSLFYYWRPDTTKTMPEPEWELLYRDEMDEYMLWESKEYYSAYTSSELGELLGEYVNEIKKVRKDWYYPEKYSVLDNMQFTEVNSRVSLLIHLKQQNLI